MNSSSNNEIKSSPRGGNVPKKFHFIWVGGPIPKKYLQTILALNAVAKRSGFEVNLWVDNEKNYSKTLNTITDTGELQGSQNSGLKIRNINELKPRIEGEAKDDFYRANPAVAKDFLRYISIEMIGSKNLAAVSDLLRYEILRQEAGIYCDTDTEFPEIMPPVPPEKPHPNDSDYEYLKQSYAGLENDYHERLKLYHEQLKKLITELKLTPDTLELGIGFSALIHYAVNGNKVVVNQWRGGSDIIAVTYEDHPVLQQSIIKSVQTYHTLEEQYASGSKLFMGEFEGNIRDEGSVLDYKRFPSTSLYSPRGRLSVEILGPKVLLDSFREYWEKFPEHQTLINIIKSSLFSPHEAFPIRRIAGIRVITHSDQTWLKSDKKLSLRGYDYEDLPNQSFFSHSNSSAPKEVKQPGQEGKKEVEKPASKRKV